MHEVLLATADGIVIFLKSDGTFLDGETFLVSCGLCSAVCPVKACRYVQWYTM